MASINLSSAPNSPALKRSWPRPLASGLALALILGAAPAYAQSEGGFRNPAQNQSGYQGPAASAKTTVAQAKTLPDDAWVTLEGHITQSLGGKHYVFKDATGTIYLEISKRRWQGQSVGPEDLVEIRGEVDQDRTTVKIEVKQITKR